MTSEELLEKGKKEFEKSIVFNRDLLVYNLVKLKAEDNIDLDILEDYWNRFVESVHYKEAIELLRYEPFVKEL